VTGKFLIDVTDPRFLIAANEHVIEFVRRTNPFAHTDVGIPLLELAKELPGAHAPSSRPGCEPGARARAGGAWWPGSGPSVSSPVAVQGV